MSRRSRAKHLIGSKVIRGLDREAVNLRTSDCIEVSSSVRCFHEGTIVTYIVHVFPGAQGDGPVLLVSAGKLLTKGRERGPSALSGRNGYALLV